MDRFFVGLTLCTCLCLAPLSTAKTAPEYAAKEERALFSVLYPRFVGWQEGVEEEIEWYSVVLSFLRGEVA